jgi:hypothetical protein
MRKFSHLQYLGWDVWLNWFWLIRCMFITLAKWPKIIENWDWRIFVIDWWGNIFVFPWENRGENWKKLKDGYCNERRIALMNEWILVIILGCGWEGSVQIQSTVGNWAICTGTYTKWIDSLPPHTNLIQNWIAKKLGRMKRMSWIEVENETSRRGTWLVFYGGCSTERAKEMLADLNFGEWGRELGTLRRDLQGPINPQLVPYWLLSIKHTMREKGHPADPNFSKKETEKSFFF